MIRTVAVIGAGAVGSFFLSGLGGREDLCVCAVAEGNRKERLDKDGLILNGEKLDLCVRSPEEFKHEQGAADLIIVCLKYGAIAEAPEMIKKIADGHTVILCPMNGVDSEEILAASLGKKHILHSMMVIAAERTERQVHYNEGVIPCVHYGRVEGYAPEEDLNEVTELFDRSGLCCKYSADIIPVMWNKFALNISTNIAQAIIGTNYGSYKSSRYMNELGQRLCDEVLAVAKAKGINCTFDNQRALKTIRTSDLARFSTLQDLMAGRHTEVDMFCGAVIRMGKECAVETPFNEFAYLAIKALEEKNDGIIF